MRRLFGLVCRWCSVALVVAVCLSAASAAEPKVLDPHLELHLFAHEPDIVTPVGITFDHKGRLLVIESHTHFPPADYAGPKHDRIRLVEDTDNDGKADRFRSFYEGSTATMSIATGPDQWIYLATRMRIFRVRDTDGDDKADEEQELAHLETKGNYPHNGLCGLTFDGHGRLYFGLGENLGEPYTLVCRDGSKLSGGGEGGNIYRCGLDGSKVEQVATGVWNPFGLCFDPQGRLFEVCNDPDSAPPCRLLHVVEGGDYGYQFRYGRTGKHPLQAWNGELPGTLPMVAGTGEAPCNVLADHGRLWVTSWGDYRIERFALKPVGASFAATQETVVQGDDQFRPVGLARAPDGSLWFSDWVDRSYPVHGKGRLWRLKWKSQPAAEDFPPLSAAEKRAASLRTTPDMKALSEADPFLHQAAVHGLRNGAAVKETTLDSLNDERQRLGLLEAARWSNITTERRDALLRAGLNDAAPDVRLFAVRWVADQRLTGFRQELDAVVESPVISAALFQATLAAMEWLDQSSVSKLPKELTREQYLLDVLSNAKRPAVLKAIALRTLPPDHPGLTNERLKELSQSNDIDVRREAVRSLVLSSRPERFTILADVARSVAAGDSDSSAPNIAADAVAGLASGFPEQRGLLTALRDQKVKAVADEAARVLARADEPAKKEQHPPLTDIAAWSRDLNATARGDAARGWRLFFGSHAARCANCHSLEGRGANIGPDLSEAAKRMTNERLLQSILQPSREVAPRYVAFVLELKDGRVMTGMPIGYSADGLQEQFIGADGKPFAVPRGDIESRVASPKSIMPEGLLDHLTRQDLKDILALLGSKAL